MGAKLGKQLDAVSCWLCNGFSSKRLTSLEKHLQEEHHTTSQREWNRLNQGPQTCKCGCGQGTKWIGWKQGYSSVVIGHNANIYAMYDEATAKQISARRIQKLKGQPGWSRGLTKETDERVRQRGIATSIGRKRAFDSGSLTAWSKGLTKETDERVAELANKAKQAFANGDRSQWHKGLTEVSDVRVKRKNEQLRARYSSNELIPWHRGKTIADEPRLAKAWQSRNPTVEYEHVRWSDDEIRDKLKSNVWLKLDDINNYKNDRTPALWVSCPMCDYRDKVSLLFARVDRCPKCCPLGSNAQHEISTWIESLEIKIAKNVKGIIGRQDLDIYVPAHKLAIEFNGLYYHSEAAGKDKNYHQSKTDKCRAVGISLFHIFEDEWKDKPDIVKSMLLHRLKLTPTHIFARNCLVTKLTSVERKAFFNSNHIDGDTTAADAYALQHNGTTVAALSLRKKFHGKKSNDVLEIARFCCKTNTNVVGGLSKIIAHLVANNHDIKKLTTYVDTRFGGRGDGYQQAKLGFCGETAVRFWWTDNHKRFNRLKFKANKKEGLTEAQVAERAGVIKIFGCKNLIFETDLTRLPSAHAVS